MLPAVRVAQVERVLGPVRVALVEQVLEPVQVQVLVQVLGLAQAQARPVRVLLVRPAQRLAVLARRRSAALRLPQPLRQE